MTSAPADEYRWDVFPFIVKVARSRSVDTIVLSGDLTDKKDHHPACLVDRLTNVIAEASKDFWIIIVKGNHDYIDPTTPFFGFLSRIENIIFVTEPEVRRIGGVECLLLPHSRDWHQRTQWRRDWPFHPKQADERYDYILAHQTFAGAQASNGQEMKGVPLSTVSAKATRGTPVLSGDIHVPQKIGNVTYVGSPHPVFFGDTFEPRVLVVSKDSVESVPNKASIIRHMLRVNGRELEGDWPDVLYEEDQVKVQLTLTRSEALDASALRARVVERIKSTGAHHFGTDVTVVAEPADRRQRFQQLDGVSTAVSATPEQVFDLYCKHRKIPKDHVEAGRKYL